MKDKSLKTVVQGKAKKAASQPVSNKTEPVKKLPRIRAANDVGKGLKKERLAVPDLSDILDFITRYARAESRLCLDSRMVKSGDIFLPSWEEHMTAEILLILL